jgi:hypothetical protein
MTVREPHVFTVEDPGIACNHDLYGFWAIGSGANRALSSLFFQEYQQATVEWRAIYYVAEAKLMAEGGAVGEDTLVMVKRRNGNSLGSFKLEQLKKLWSKEGRPKIPRDTEAVVAASIEKDFFTLSEPTAPSTSQTSKPEQ